MQRVLVKAYGILVGSTLLVLVVLAPFDWPSWFTVMLCVLIQCLFVLPALSIEVVLRQQACTKPTN